MMDPVGDIVGEIQEVMQRLPECEGDAMQKHGCKASLDDFRDFVLVKSFEVLGNDQEYKRFFSTSKDHGEPWALKMHSSMLRVLGDIKAVQACVESLQTQGRDRVHRMCMETVVSSSPYIGKKAGWHVCSISGIRSDSCVEVGKKGRDGSTVLVHSKFIPFILNLWFVVKLEHIIKNQARAWAAQQDEDNVAELCKKYEARTEVFEDWYKIFCHAVVHVKYSITECCEETTAETGYK